jgi:cell division protease FtsH
VISQKEKQIVAYHEAGHALVARLLPGSDPVHKISVVARGMAGGYTKQLPTEDRHFYSITQLRDKITGALGGRAAEEIIFGPDEVTTGARSDLEVVTELARRMIKEYGMSSKLGLRTFGRREDMVFLGRVVDEQKDYGDTIADEIDHEIKLLIDEAYAEAKDILTKNKDRLIHIAKRLITEETLEGDVLETAFTEPVSEDTSEEAPAPQS